MSVPSRPCSRRVECNFFLSFGGSFRRDAWIEALNDARSTDYTAVLWLLDNLCFFPPSNSIQHPLSLRDVAFYVTANLVTLALAT